MRPPRRLGAVVTLALVVAVAACARVAPNRPVEGAPYPVRYPFETPGLYAPTYPADAAERQRLRDKALDDQGRLLPPPPLPPDPGS
ncbi:hypothetical protein [Pararhodospirillum oryzae]|uniref:Lipoprotein n=1 Tax=Pararhodospirillum oryzae TaxID=478448 RepID=A0A512H3D5_9PROT|nr:hypothetical protein [Pararhodospirillum oryzae]GEO79972.1 hypothetical protein ROR02_01030 [Pararhodospirillum oryzae]